MHTGRELPLLPPSPPLDCARQSQQAHLGREPLTITLHIRCEALDAEAVGLRRDCKRSNGLGRVLQARRQQHLRLGRGEGSQRLEQRLDDRQAVEEVAAHYEVEGPLRRRGYECTRVGA